MIQRKKRPHITQRRSTVRRVQNFQQPAHTLVSQRLPSQLKAVQNIPCVTSHNQQVETQRCNNLSTVIIPIESTIPAHTLPDCLYILGNRKAWELFSKSIQECKAIVLYGPTGCGKTEGIHSYLKQNGIGCTEIDISDFESAIELDIILRDTRCKSQAGERALLVDCVEGIAAFPTFIDVLLKRLNKQRSGGHRPLILTCDDLYSYENRRLKALVDGNKVVGIRMFPPFKSACIKYFSQFYDKSWINLATSEVNNDLRQIHKFLTACSEREAFLKERGEFFQHRKRVAFPHEQCRPIYTNFPLSL